MTKRTSWARSHRDNFYFKIISPILIGFTNQSSLFQHRVLTLRWHLFIPCAAQKIPLYFLTDQIYIQDIDLTIPRIVLTIKIKRFLKLGIFHFFITLNFLAFCHYLVHCVKVTEGFDWSTGCHQDVLGSRMIRDEIRDVVNTFPVVSKTRFQFGSVPIWLNLTDL